MKQNIQSITVLSLHAIVCNAEFRRTRECERGPEIGITYLPLLKALQSPLVVGFH